MLANRNQLLQIFGSHAQIDGNLHTTDGLLKLFDARRHHRPANAIKQIPFPADLPALHCRHGPNAPARSRRAT